jgi:transcriptional regulator GlxA family with amidase domain
MAYDLTGLYSRVSKEMRRNPYSQLRYLSRHMGVGRHTIEKSVKAATGKSFREYRANMLLAHARLRLGQNPNLSIKEIAFSIGFRSQRSFCRFIKATAGCSPKVLRETGKMPEEAVA